MIKQNKKRKKSNRKKLVKLLDKYFSIYIRTRDKNICFTCDKTLDNMQCGHLITRAKYSVRWNEKNACCQCAGCNLKHEYYPEIFTQKYINKFGIDQYNELVQKSNELSDYSNTELELMIEFFKKKIKELEDKK